MSEKITIQDLMEAGVHFGHQVKRWNPKMKEYVYGVKDGIYIIDLTKTMRQLADACNFLQDVVAKGGEILFVGTKRQAQEIVKEAAEKTGMFYVADRWLGGTLTNFVTIRKSINKMRSIDNEIANNSSSMTKKEVALLARKAEKLHKNLDGICEMKKMPTAIFVIDTCNEEIAVRESKKLNIPVVGIVDTNADPENIDYPIPGNDDAIRSIKILTSVIADSVAVAADFYRKKAAEEKAKSEKAEKTEKAKKSKTSNTEDKGTKAEEKPKTVKKAADKKEDSVEKTAPKKTKSAKAEKTTKEEKAKKFEKESKKSE